MTFLFDIGNVLLKLHFERFHLAILGSGSTPLPEPLMQLKDPYETGKMTDREFVTQALEILGHPLTPPEFIAAWEDIFTPNEPMWQVVRALKKQDHRLILFSNTNSIHARHFLKTFSDFALFDHHHFSQEVGAIKPDPEFYQAAIDKFQLDCAETLYLDDLPENIAAGKLLGLASWQYDFNQHDDCLQWIADQGVTLAPLS